MATEHLSPALRAPASSRPYAKARPGYGKRTVPGQGTPRPEDFALLPERERHIAGYVDHLPDGAAMDIKTLAKHLPPYGQMAVASALKALGIAGHLRRVRCLAGEAGQVRWVSRTYWSRTAHDNEWWDTFLTGPVSHPVENGPEAAPTPPPTAAESPAPAPAPVSASASASASAASLTAQAEPAAQSAPVSAPAAPAAVPEQRTPTTMAQAAHSPAYLALAQLGRRDPRLALSAADCAALEPLAAEWFTRGVDADYLTQALVSGLPSRIGSPVGFARRRLTDKVPPHLPSSPTPATTAATIRRVLAECTGCGRPGPAEALPDGLCRTCRPTASNTTSAAAPTGPSTARDVHALVAELRDLTRLP
ncbi:MarR family transcriptional regulator [Streptomyces sp. NPDC058330]|uniref:MarR family transcriptional regulator n=1 Tax=Streptomyces sp. NPDC058330 TaxID=3346449 RepID=UPI0036E68DBB